MCQKLNDQEEKLSFLELREIVQTQKLKQCWGQVLDHRFWCDIELEETVQGFLDMIDEPKGKKTKFSCLEAKYPLLKHTQNHFNDPVTGALKVKSMKEFD